MSNPIKFYTPNEIMEELNKSWHSMDREKVHDILYGHAKMIDRCVEVVYKMNIEGCGSKSAIPIKYTKEQVIDLLNYVLHGENKNNDNHI